jgi:hypothetical protein
MVKVRFYYKRDCLRHKQATYSGINIEDAIRKAEGYYVSISDISSDISSFTEMHRHSEGGFVFINNTNYKQYRLEHPRVEP